MSWNTPDPQRVVPFNNVGAKEADFPAGTDQVLDELARLLIMEGERRTGYRLHPGWCWGQYVKDIAGTNTLSYHGKAGGRALDINAPTNGRGGRGDIPGGFVKLMEEYGWTWGGRWSYTDPMHFEWHGSPESARRALARLRRELADAEAPRFRTVYYVGDHAFRKQRRALSYLQGKLKSAEDQEVEYLVHVERERRG